MKPISLLAMAILVVSLSHLQEAHAKNQQNPKLETNDLINKACSSTPNSNLCKKLLESSPKSKGADLHGLAEILLDMVSDDVGNIYDKLNQVQNGTNVDSFMDQCLTDCLESYQDAIDQIEDSVTALDFTAYSDIKTWINAALSDATTCDMGFREKPGYESPVAQMSKAFDQTCNIILAITEQLSQGQGNGNVSS